MSNDKININIIFKVTIQEVCVWGGGGVKVQS